MRHMIENLIHILFPPRDESGFFISWKHDDYYSKLTRGTYHPEYHSLFSYKDEYVRKLIYSLKKERIKRIGKHISQIFAEEILSWSNEDALIHTDKIYLIPIPISKQRYKERGFNQVAWISELTARELGCPYTYTPDILIKHKDTQKQSTLSRSQRLQNIKGSFKVTGNIKNAYIILIDDVITTGATIHEAQKMLKRAGAKKVDIFCVAH